jgi:predicted O-methyltransferase YrrM
LYTDIVNWAKDDYYFLEMGAWRGCSTAYMIVEIINSEKKIKFDVVDCFNDDSCNIFLDNLNTVSNYYNLVRGYSEMVSKKYKDESLDFVFIDGNHDYDNIKLDITSWLSKVKKGGIIAGHDYHDIVFPGVVQAVKEFFGNNYYVTKSGCWVFKK